MKSIVFLGAFALLIILTLGDVPQESSQDVAEASEFGLLEREAREAGRKKKRGNKRNRKGKKKGKKFWARKRNGKGNGNGNGNGKGKAKGKGTGRKGNGKGKGKAKDTKMKTINNQRNNTCITPPCTVSAAHVAKAFSEYRKGTNRLRQVKRIVKWINQMAKKAEKAAHEFPKAAEALDEATNSGSDCNGALANSTIKAYVLILNNCSASAKALCTPPASVSESEAKSCIDSLERSVNSTKAWLSDPNSSTYPPVFPNTTCVEFAKSKEPNVKNAREGCISTSRIGSFGYCSAILKKVGGLIITCGKIEPNPPPQSAVVTSAPGRHRIFKFQQQFL